MEGFINGGNDGSLEFPRASAERVTVLVWIVDVAVS